jgi:hypothetical protein
MKVVQTVLQKAVPRVVSRDAMKAENWVYT